MLRIKFAKNGLGYFFGDFFANSSGHPTIEFPVDNNNLNFPHSIEKLDQPSLLI
jgi:hypothetical protein